MVFTGTTTIDGSSFTIRELTGDQRVVQLVGRGMPYRPLGFKGKQAITTTWLPGNPIATATVLGPQEDPTDVNGYWKDKFIGDPASVAGIGAPIQLNGNPVTTVRDAIKLLDDIRRSGQMLEVTWDIQVRHGFLEEFEARWQNVHDCEWTMKYTWVSQGDQAGAAAVAADMSAIDLQTKLLANMGALSDAAFPPEIPTSLAFMDVLQSSFQKLNAFVTDVGGATANLAQLAMTPLQVARQCIAACANIIGVVSDTIGTIDDQAISSYNMAIGKAGEGALLGGGSNLSNFQNTTIALGGSGIFNISTGSFNIGGLSAGATTFNKPLALAQRQRIGQVVTDGRSLDYDRLAMTERVQAYVYVRAIRRALYALRSSAIQGMSQFSKQVQFTTQGTYIVKNGDDLRRISELYYATPFNWQLIAQFNELETFDLVAGQAILIPFVPTGEV